MIHITESKNARQMRVRIHESLDFLMKRVDHLAQTWNTACRPDRCMESSVCPNLRRLEDAGRAVTAMTQGHLLENRSDFIDFRICCVLSGQRCSGRFKKAPQEISLLDIT